MVIIMCWLIRTEPHRWL